MKLNWKPALNKDSGENTNITNADAKSALRANDFLPKMNVAKEKPIIMVALTTEGGNPVRQSYNITIIKESTKRHFFMP